MKKPKGKTPVEMEEPAPEAAAPQISLEDYTRILGGLEFRGLALSALTCIVTGRGIIVADPSAIAQKLDLSCAFLMMKDEDDGKDVAIVTQQFALTLSREEQPMAVVQGAFQLDYGAKEGFTPEFFESFKTTTLLLQVIPYIRELIQTMTSRLGIPPVLLPIIRFDGDGASMQGIAEEDTTPAHK